VSIKKLLAVGAMSGGLLASVAGVAVASTSSPAATARTTAVVHQAGSTAAQPGPSGEASETSTEASGEATSPADGPGGHQDATGQNVDHQFSGNE
jgi:uncharacterized low-complexity protein